MCDVKLLMSSMAIFVMTLMVGPVLAQGETMAGQEATKSPGIGDEELFAALDLDRKGLEKVKAATAAGDYAAAKAALLDYYRGRRSPQYFFNWWDRGTRKVNRDLKRADQVCEHIFHGTAVDAYPPHQMGAEIDWAANPYHDREWAWSLNRHFFWPTLGEAYWASGDEKYAREFTAELTDWARRCPLVTDGKHNSSVSWRTIETGIRASLTWMSAYQYFLQSPSFTPEANALFLESLIEHAHHLVAHPTGGNWLIMECSGLAHIGVLFPEFREAAKWRETAYGRLAEQLKKQIYTDGFQVELTTAYHQACIHHFTLAYDLAKLNGVDVAPDYVQNLERLYECAMYILKPSGWQPALNDADARYAKKTAEGELRTDATATLRKGAELFGRSDFLYVATNEREGRLPTDTSHAFTWAGYYVMRSGYDREARYLLFDAGPFGAGHQHEDKLNFELHAFGDTLLLDPGRHAYAGSPFRSYFLSTASHNTALVDGQGQARRHQPANERHWISTAPVSNTWKSSTSLDYATGSYDEGYGAQRDRDVTHWRQVFFVKPDYWVIYDQFTGVGAHQLDTLFHFPPVPVKQEEGEYLRAVRSVSEDRANVAVIAPTHELTVKVMTGQREPVQGWVSPGYNQQEAAPCADFGWYGELPVGFAYVLYPMRPGEQTQVKVEAIHVTYQGKAVGPEAAIALRLVTSQGVDYLMMSRGLSGEKRFGRWTTKAPAACFRCDLADKLKATLEVSD